MSGAGKHVPVMLSEVIAALAPKDGAHYIDGTFGGGGYAEAILEAADCRVLGIDRDPEAIARGQALVQRFAGRIPLLGVCLGHQTIGVAFGAKVEPAKRLMHGKTSPIRHDGHTIFAGVPQPFAAMRYHSLVLERSGLPTCLEISATSDDDEIMALRHREWLVEGVQFHPESILTIEGKHLLRNFLQLSMVA